MKAIVASLPRGDLQPLLRLSAEGTFGLTGDSGVPTFDSAGDFYANRCTDPMNLWDWARLVRSE